MLKLNLNTALCVKNYLISKEFCAEIPRIPYNYKYLCNNIFNNNNKII